MSGKSKSIQILISIIIMTLLVSCSVLNIFGLNSAPYPIVDTGQEKCFNASTFIGAPSENDAFYGQDAQYDGNEPSYTDNGDGTVTDNVTGLIWTQSADINNDAEIDINDKLSYEYALTYADELEFAGYNDWRLPSIKELYSLIMFYGLDPSGLTNANEPFINTEYFDFAYGDESAGERPIDAQFATTTLYVGTIFNGEEGIFGVNFADGRIKCYPTDKLFYIYLVRGEEYGVNDFADNRDGTITDKATDLMWAQEDSDSALNWEEALNYVQELNEAAYLGYNDWRLPNVKELQSIVDYTRSPSTTSSAAIDPLFECSVITDEGGNDNYPFYWSSTTHENPVTGEYACYIAFGEGLGWMESPPMSGNYTLMDVHGAGCQRSDPKSGDPDDYPYGFGPQGDVRRIYNYVRVVRSAP